MTGETKYYIVQRNGGPTIDLFQTGLVEVEGKPALGSGSISYYPTFWNTLTEENQKPPKALAKFYRHIVSRIKANSTKLVRGERVYCIGPGAQKLVEQGLELSA